MGAIVPGTSYTGDKVPAMVNSGEMIINKEQQKGMLSALGSLAVIGGTVYGANKLGGRVGIRGAGSTMLLANILGGGKTDMKSLIEAHLIQSAVRRMLPFGKAVKGVGEASAGATRTVGSLSSVLTKSLNKLGPYGQRLSKATSSFIASYNGVEETTATAANKNKSKKSKKARGKATPKQKTLADVKKQSKATSKVTKVANTAKNAAAKGTKSAVDAAKVLAKNSKALGAVKTAGKAVAKKIPYIGTALAVGGAAMGIASASSEYNDKVREIENTSMSGLEKARAKDEAIKEKNKSIGKSVGSAAGGLGGMAAGAAAGAAIGSVVPVVGTAIGGLIGGALGAFGGEKLGGIFGKGIGGLFGGSEEKKFKKEQDAKFATSSRSGTQVSQGDDLLTVVKSIEAKMPGRKSIGVSPISMAALGIAGPVVAAVKALPDIGNFMKVKPSREGEKVVAPTTIGKTDINLNVSGTIKLEGAGKSVDFDINKLLETDEFKRKLPDIITKRLDENSNAGKRNMESEKLNMSNQYNRTGGSAR